MTEESKNIDFSYIENTEDTNSHTPSSSNSLNRTLSSSSLKQRTRSGARLRPIVIHHVQGEQQPTYGRIGPRMLQRVSTNETANNTETEAETETDTDTEEIIKLSTNGVWNKLTAWLPFSSNESNTEEITNGSLNNDISPPNSPSDQSVPREEILNLNETPIYPGGALIPIQNSSLYENMANIANSHSPTSAAATLIETEIRNIHNANKRLQLVAEAAGIKVNGRKTDGNGNVVKNGNYSQLFRKNVVLPHGESPDIEDISLKESRSIGDIHPSHSLVDLRFRNPENSIRFAKKKVRKSKPEKFAKPSREMDEDNLNLTINKIQRQIRQLIVEVADIKRSMIVLQQDSRNWAQRYSRRFALLTNLVVGLGSFFSRIMIGMSGMKIIRGIFREYVAEKAKQSVSRGWRIGESSSSLVSRPEIKRLMLQNMKDGIKLSWVNFLAVLLYISVDSYKRDLAFVISTLNVLSNVFKNRNGVGNYLTFISNFLYIMTKYSHILPLFIRIPLMS